MGNSTPTAPAAATPAPYHPQPAHAPPKRPVHRRRMLRTKPPAPLDKTKRAKHGLSGH